MRMIELGDSGSRSARVSLYMQSPPEGPFGSIESGPKGTIDQVSCDMSTYLFSFRHSSFSRMYGSKLNYGRAESSHEV